MTITIIINIKAINSLKVNLIEINNLIKFAILINLKRMIDQIIILIRRQTKNARMQK